MTDILKKGMAFLNNQRQAHMAGPVEYRRDGLGPISLDATHCRTDIEITDDYGATVTSFVEDFVLTADLLGFEPEPCDVIVADGRKYEVMNLGGDGCWRWTSHRQAYRIHTKDVGADT